MDQFAPGFGGRAENSSAYLETRRRSETLAASLTDEDRVIQSMPDASPVNWHLAHTTWFFEQFVLRALDPGYVVHDEDYHYLFNSYYESLGARQPRPLRGMITRPASREILAWRAHVDAAMESLLDRGRVPASLLALGLAHEEQHQELLLTDAMHALSLNPLAWGRRPIAVLPGWVEPVQGKAAPVAVPHGIASVGAAGVRDGARDGARDGNAFAFDNEGPRHEVLLHAARLDGALVTNAAWRHFIEEGGYARPELWMSDGWACVQAEGWTTPLYWREIDGVWWQFGPGGAAPLVDEAPVRHVSWYEADAFARWAGARLPTEHEIEVVSASLPGLFGHVWQWTASAYTAYPGFRPQEGAIGEYNGKFMINQMVLRGGSFATAPGHARATYRNFFHPEKRWQVTGLRLARDD